MLNFELTDVLFTYMLCWEQEHVLSTNAVPGCQNVIFEWIFKKLTGSLFKKMLQPLYIMKAAIYNGENELLSETRWRSKMDTRPYKF